MARYIYAVEVLTPVGAHILRPQVLAIPLRRRERLPHPAVRLSVYPRESQGGGGPGQEAEDTDGLTVDVPRVRQRRRGELQEIPAGGVVQ